jgi:hypothetical protein
MLERPSCGLFPAIGSRWFSDKFLELLGGRRAFIFLLIFVANFAHLGLPLLTGHVVWVVPAQLSSCIAFASDSSQGLETLVFCSSVRVSSSLMRVGRAAEMVVPAWSRGARSALQPDCQK